MTKGKAGEREGKRDGCERRTELTRTTKQQENIVVVNEDQIPPYPRAVTSALLPHEREY